MKKRKILLGVLLATAIFTTASCDGSEDKEKASDVQTDPSDNEGQETKYTVSFYTYGGTSVDSQEIAKGGKVTRPANPTKAADAQYTYTFAGWYSDSLFSTEFDFNTEINSNKTLYAKWNETVNQYTVTFVTNGGSTVDPVNLNYNSKLPRPTDPQKTATENTRYAFAGWYKDAELTQAFNFNSDRIKQATTLYAKWDETDRVSVIFNTNGGTSVDTQLVFPGEKATQPANPTKEETATAKYAFAGWFKDAQCTEAFDFNAEINDTVTVYAGWTVTNKYTVTFVTNGADATIPTQTIYDGGKATQPADPTKAETATEKYDFAGWYLDEDCLYEFDFNTEIKANTTLYADWDITDKYTVTFETNGGTTIASQVVYDGDKVTGVTNPTKAQTVSTVYTFAGWYTTSDFQEGSEFNIDEDEILENTTLYAKWTETTRQYAVAFNSNGGTSVTGQKVDYNGYVTKPEDPTKESDDDTKVIKFAGWYTDSALTKEFSFDTPITGTTVLYAKWDTYNKISTVEEFNAFRALEASNDNYILTADIDLEGVVLEATAVAFAGKFDGNGFAIKNATYVENSANKTGLLVKDLHNGSVKNLKFTGCVAKHNGETLSMIAGMAGGKIEVSKIEFNGCILESTTYAGFIVGRIDTAKTTLTMSEITCKNGCQVKAGQYTGTLLGDVDKTDSDANRTTINLFDCDLDIELSGSNANGGFLSGRIRKFTNFNVKNVLIRNAVLPSTTGLICGGGANNATYSTVTVENLYVMNTNAAVLQSCASQTGSNPVSTFSITYTNCYMASDCLANVTDNTVNGTTYLQGVDKTTTDINWLDETLKLDFENTWTAEENDPTAYRLKASSTNVKSDDAVIDRLKVNTANATVRFERGIDFSAAGLAVTGIYSDGVNLLLTAGKDYEVISEGYDKNVAGQYTITVKSLEDESVVATYTVEVVELESFEVDTNYAKLTYMVGEEINISNLVVYGNWSDGKKLLYKTYTTNVENLSTEIAGAKELEITVKITGYFEDVQSVRLSVIDTKPVVVDNYAYINVDADAVLEYAGERVDGVETFNTINEAVEYLVSANLGKDVNKVMYIADGVYHEKITIPASLANLKIIGESREDTIIEYDAVEDTVNPLNGNKFTMDCATLHVNAENFGLENITVNNSFNYINEHNNYGNPQGFALTIAADRAVINNVTLYGNQDTLFFKKGRVYLKNSEIQGNIDFIFGENDGIAFFDHCVIRAINKSTTQENNNGYCTAMKGDEKTHPTYGYVFSYCEFTDDGTLKAGSMSLGRPWGPGASVAMINCSFTAAYSTAGYDGSTKSRWFDMSGNKPQNAYFVEYGSTGDGAIDTAVTGGSILTSDEALNYTAANTLAPKNGGVDWGDVVFDYTAAYNALVAAQNKVEATALLVYLDGKEITEDTLTVAKEDTSNLVVVPAEWNAFDKECFVEIDDETLATYDNGKISGLELGSTTITLTIGDVTKVMTLEVIELPSYTVTFVTNGGTAVDAQTVKRYKTVDQAATVTSKENAVFKGWFLDENFEEEYDFSTQITADLTLYARFVDYADLTKENCVYYFNGTEGDGVDTFGDGINIQKKEGTWYSISVGGDTSVNKIQSRWNNTDPNKVNPDTQFNSKTTLSFAVEKYATVIITFRNLNGALILFKFNGETITPTVSADGLTFTYETTTAGVFMMENNGNDAVGAVKNSYLSSISVTYPEVIEEATQITFGTNGNYKDMTALDQSAAAYTEVKDPHTQMTGQLVFYVNPGAIISINGNWGIDFTINDGDRIQNTNAGGSYSGTSYEYVSTQGGKIVIKAGESGKNYLSSIKITYPAVLEESTTITFGTGGNYKDGIDGVIISGSPREHDSTSCQFSNQTIKINLKAAATITFVGNWAMDFSIGDTVVQTAEAGGTAELNGYVYNAEAGELTITIGDTSKCYIKSIQIEY